ncbi:MAG: hypothetical protein ACI35Q_01130 [Marinilabiliaceae bacterium]
MLRTSGEGRREGLIGNRRREQFCNSLFDFTAHPQEANDAEASVKI